MTIHPISSSTFIIIFIISLFIVLYFTVLQLLLINVFLFCSVHMRMFYWRPGITSNRPVYECDVAHLVGKPVSKLPPTASAD